MESAQGRSRLQSALTGCVELPRVRTSIGQRSFTFYGRLTVWISKPAALRDGSLSLNTFDIWRVIFSNSHEHHPALLWRLAILAQLINITSYLLTSIANFLCEIFLRTRTADSPKFHFEKKHKRGILLDIDNLLFLNVGPGGRDRNKSAVGNRVCPALNHLLLQHLILAHWLANFSSEISSKQLSLETRFSARSVPYVWRSGSVRVHTGTDALPAP